MGTRTRDRLAPRVRPLLLCLFPPATEAAVKGVPGVRNGLFPARARGAAQKPAGPAGSNLLGHQGNRAGWRPRPPDHSVCHAQGLVSPDARTVPALASAFSWMSPTTRRGGVAPEPGAGVRAPFISEDSGQRQRHGGPCV